MADINALRAQGAPDLSTPTARLRHVVDIYDVQGGDDRLLVTATSNVYGSGVSTGLTWGDLAEILALIAPDADDDRD